MPKLVTAALVAAVASSSAGCGPCTGVLDCGATDRHIAVEGTLLTPLSGLPVEGARMVLVVRRANGLDSTAVTTTGTGTFSLSIASAPGDSPRLSLHVQPSDSPGYVIDSLPCEPVTREADACVLNPIIESPRLPIFVLRYRNDMERPVTNARMSFQQTGGPGLYGKDLRMPLTVVTDGDGVAQLFAEQVFTTSIDPVVGDLTIEMPAPYSTAVYRGYKVRPSFWFGSRPAVYQGVGPSLSYSVLFSDSVTRGGRAGVSFRFERTAGIHMSRDTFVAVSRDDGWTGFMVVPLSEGIVEGNLTISVPGAAPLTYSGLSVRTFDADSVIFWGHWLVGSTGALYPLRPFPP